VLVPTSLLFGWALAPGSEDLSVAQVSGRVTCADQPFSGVIYFLSNDDEGGVLAVGPVNPDGSFQLYVNDQRRGVVPGTYRVTVRPSDPDKTEPCIDRKYQHARTTNLLVHVGSDWNYFDFNLHRSRSEPGPVPGKTRS
jgi:hypothetical protein